MRRLHQALAGNGTFEFLLALSSSSKTYYDRDEIGTVMRSCGISDTDATLHELVAERLLTERGCGFILTSLGLRTSLLLEAMNGADLRDVFRRLGKVDSTLRTYELVREGMTRVFLRSLLERPGFGRLYLCSPWISFDQEQENTLAHAIHRFESRYGRLPDVLVITRPEEGTDATIPRSAQLLRTFDARFLLNKSLHTKLYIREPGPNGGYMMAIIGSQNLTRSRYLELGIRINSDAGMINQLISHFFDISSTSQEA